MILQDKDEFTNTINFKYIVQTADIAYTTYNLCSLCEGNMGTMLEKNKDLFELASTQQGLFTAKQAEQVGFVSNNHSYHVKAGHWIREGRGVYRLALFPKSADEQKAMYALWSQNREGKIQGVYSHETALAHYEISDANPSKLYMTVPKSFLRNSKIPKVLKLHYADLTKEMIHESRGFLVTKIGRTISDIIQCGWVPFDIIRQAVLEAHQKGLMQKWEIESTIAHVQVSDEIHEQLHQLQKEVK
jgi:predicted transcriptional regulator of viral defense system